MQRTLDSNYGLFWLIVTDCKISTKYCLSEQILYQSKSSQKWTKEISLATLSNHPYDLLQNPPPLQTERQYAKPDDSKPIPTGRVNSGEIIGRVYYVREDRRHLLKIIIIGLKIHFKEQVPGLFTH